MLVFPEFMPGLAAKVRKIEFGAFGIDQGVSAETGNCMESLRIPAILYGPDKFNHLFLEFCFGELDNPVDGHPSPICFRAILRRPVKLSFIDKRQSCRPCGPYIHFDGVQGMRLIYPVKLIRKIDIKMSI